MLQGQINTLINTLGCWYEDGSQPVDPKEIVEYGTRVGILVDPRLNLETVQNFLDTYDVNPNSTFYRCWNDVVEKDRLDLFIDQIFHYMSTYGTDYEGPVYVPNDDPIKIDYVTYRKIVCVSYEEMLNKVMNLLKGISLGSFIVESAAAFIHDAYRNGTKIDFESIENKEVLCSLYYELGITPSNTDSIRRCIQYMITGSAMIIQNRDNLYKISHTMLDEEQSGYIKDIIDTLYNNKDLLIKMSSEFLRYKKWWLAIKYATKEDKIRMFINKLREMARKTHKPSNNGFWEDLTKHSDPYIKANIDKEIRKLNNPFKIIRLLEMIRLHQLQVNSNTKRIFKIRNGKTFISDKRAGFSPLLLDVSKMLLRKLIDIVSYNREQKYCKGEYANRWPAVRFPKDLVLMVPSSGKTFVGNIPFGSYYLMDDMDNFLGVYWRNEWGTHDFDLSLIDVNGNKIGWNSTYYDTGVVFSGDMTDANPEATELMSIKGLCPECIVKVNRYNGEQGSKYRLIFGQERINNIHKNYMVNPNNIKLQVDVTSDQREQNIGYIKDQKCYLMNFGTGDNTVSISNPDLVRAWGDQCFAHIPLREILLAAGYREYVPFTDDELEVDLVDSGKDVILDLL